MMERTRHFASDNWSEVCPEAWAELERANHGHAPAYGNDAWSLRATELLRATFEADCDVYFLFTGTAANALALATICRPAHGIVCHELSHIRIGECGATEFFSAGAKLLPVSGALGKLDAPTVSQRVLACLGTGAPPVRALSVSQATELGTVYTATEVSALGNTAKELGLSFHVDGARFANAVAALGISPAEFVRAARIDVLSLGAAKNGGCLGDAVVFFDRGLAKEFAYRQKQAGQLGAKMRFLAAPWVGLLESGAWLRHAAHANAMARRLALALGSLDPVRILHPVETNAVFAEVPARAITALHDRGWSFHTIGDATTCRWMCAWDTREEDVDEFVGDLRGVL